MNDSSTLARAFQLIEDDRLDEARALLQPILAQDRDNADAWWLLAHAVTDVESARQALDNVRQLDPDYPGLVELNRALEARLPTPAPARSAIRSLGRPAPPPSIPDIPESMPEPSARAAGEEFQIDDLDLEEAIEEHPPRRRRRIPLIVGIVAVFVVLVVAALVIINPFRQRQVATPTGTAGAQGPGPTATGVAATPTITAQATRPTQTFVPQTPTATETESVSPTPDIAAFYSALSAYSVPEDGVDITQTTLGDTIVVTVCEDRGALADVMAIVARASLPFADTVQGVAVRIGDCEVDGSMRLIGVSMGHATAFAEGSLTEQDFQRAWRPLG